MEVSGPVQCPFCKTALESGTRQRNLIECPACGTMHHGRCWKKHGGCSVFGCGQPAQPDVVRSANPMSGRNLIAALIIVAFSIAFYGAWISIGGFWKVALVCVVLMAAFLFSVD